MLAQKPDSLLAVWQDSVQMDSIRIQAFNLYIRKNFLFSNPDSAITLAGELVDYGTQKKVLSAKSIGYHLQGIANYFKGNYPKALDYYTKSLQIREELQDKEGISASLNNIGIIYRNQGNLDRALEYYNRSLKIDEERNDQMGCANSLNNIANIHYDKQAFDLAQISYEKSLGIFKELKNWQGVANTTNNLAYIFKSKGKNKEAIEFHLQSLEIFKNLDDKRGIAACLIGIGAAYRELEQYKKAIEFATKGLTLAQELDILPQIEEACRTLYASYKSLGKNSEALLFLEKIQVIKDTLHARETAEKLQQMEFSKEMLTDSIAKAEEMRLLVENHQEELRQRTKTRNILIVTTVGILILTGGIFNRLQFTRKSKAELQLEKDRSESLLLNILPEEIAKELKEKGKADARDFFLVSIMFTDFKAFTETSSLLSAAELVYEVNACFEAFDGIIDKYNIEKIKTIGDAYMAAGGLPVPSDESVKNTVLAALEMQRFMEERKTNNISKNKAYFEMRVGIHSGPVVAGIVGVKKFQYDIWGDTVNTANRMETSGVVGKVNISRDTYEHIKEDSQFTFIYRGQIEVKGKGDLDMYFVDLK